MARKLGRLKPARFRAIAEQECRVHEKLRTPWRRLAEHLWTVFQLPGKARTLAADIPFELTAEMDAALSRATKWYVDAIVGYGVDADSFAQPSMAAVDVNNPLHNGKPILPGELRTGFQAGIDRALVVTGADAPAILGVRNEAAVQEMMRDAFGLLSEGARVTLGDVLTEDTYSGGSVHKLLMDAMHEGQNPLQTARALNAKFTDIEGYQWARLSRTETAFAQNTAMQAEYHAEGYRPPLRADGTAIEFAPYHPNCVCGVTIDPEGGYMLPDVSATACFVCQAALAEANVLTRNAEGVKLAA